MCRRINDKKVLWFSRHQMSYDQVKALGTGVGEIIQVNKTIKSAQEIKEEIDNADVIAVVAPLVLQQEILELAGSKPVIVPVIDRVKVRDNLGYESTMVRFIKWKQVKELHIVEEDYIPV